MNPPGEYLFDSDSDDLVQFIENLDEHRNTINATVAGTDNYSVSVYLEEGVVYGACTCPYYDVCKHLVAILLHLKREGSSPLNKTEIPLPGNSQTGEILNKHLDSLSKSELVDLVMDFAPKSYITRIQNQSYTSGDALTVFATVENNIKKFLNDEEFLWDPSGFEGALMGQIDLLRGLENRLVDKIGGLLIYIIDGINNAFDEGYLYLDGYPDDDYFESEDFCKYVQEFVRILPFELKMEYIPKLAEALNRMSYDTFSTIDDSFYSFFTDNEFIEVKEYFVKHENPVADILLSRLYKYIEPGLTDSEKEKILFRLIDYDYRYVTELCRFLSGQQRYQEAYDIVSSRIDSMGEFIGDEMVEMYLVITKKLGYDLIEPAMKAIEIFPTTFMLIKIKSLVSGPLTEYENILRHKNPDQLLCFYESENRLEDALALISKESFWDPELFRFFKKNKKSIPEEAAEYFVKRIQENLAGTGDKYYEKIAESIGQLKQVKRDKADKLLNVIRSQYKRRRKLMDMLERY